MAQITNYGTLKSSIAAWLNRNDLDVEGDSQIEQFIGLAERRIYRKLRSIANETRFDFIMTAVTDEFVLPQRYLSAKAFTYNTYPLERISLWEYNNRKIQSPNLQGEPKYFTRDLEALKIWPYPSSGKTASLSFYADFSGLGSNSSLQLLIDGDPTATPPIPPDPLKSQNQDTNNVLKIAPDVYLFGSLIYAGAFLGSRPEDEQKWKAMYAKAYFELENYGKDEDLSGSLILATNFEGGYVR